MSDTTDHAVRRPHVKVFVRPFNYWHDFYQLYYQEGLRRHVESTGGVFERIAMSRFPRTLRHVRRVRDSYRLHPVFEKAKWTARAIDATGARMEGRIKTPSDFFHDGTGQYLITDASGREHKVCIDSADYGELPNRDLVAWCDVYFKTNYWRTHDYPPHVRPLINGDPLVIPQIGTFRSYRDAPKEYDLCCIVRVWGGSSSEVEGIEHNLRLIESLARVDCKKFLLAYLVAGDIDAYAKRLSAQGIPWTTAPMPADELWRITAASRLNVMRLGMHYCIPWRLTGALAIGSCVVFDRAPLTEWAEPLRDEINYLSLGIEVAPDQVLAPEHQYEDVPGKISQWLAEPKKIANIARHNSAYFDRCADPVQVGAHIMRQLSL